MREGESEVEILGTMGPVIDENLVRAQGTRTRVGAGQVAIPAPVPWRVEESRG